MNRERLIQHYVDALNSGSIKTRMEIIRLLPKLGGREPYEVIKAVLKSGSNLGMKLECLQILPEIASTQSREDISQLIGLAISNEDTEVIRSLFLAIQSIPPSSIADEVIKSIAARLLDDDTDIQYEAIKCLLHLRSEIPSREFLGYIEPFTEHPNKVLRETAKKALDMGKQL